MDELPVTAEAAVAASKLILLAPIEPASGGNGLAMRTELFRRAAAAGLGVDVVVVPVAGRLPAPTTRPPGPVFLLPDPVEARKGARALLADVVWRDRLTRASVLPRVARTASPGLASAVVAALDIEGPVALHVMRSYLAPLGAAVAEQLETTWATLDLDEDDAAFAAARGAVHEAAAYERLLDVFGGLFDGLCAASPVEAGAISRRHGLCVDHVPNAVDLPVSVAPRLPEDHRNVSLLFVGNLTYAPNVEAVSTLVETVLPAVRRRLRRPVRVTLVGSHDRRTDGLAGPAVDVRGYVPDLGPVYAAADVVVVPLEAGAGTRIKLLEAFAYGVPVVASSVAASGLAVSDGRHLLLADGAAETAAAVDRIVGDPALASRLAEEARRLVRDSYSTAAVTPAIRDLFARAAARAGLRCGRAGSR